MRLVREGVAGLTAVYLRIWLEDELAFLGRCPWEEDLAYVREVCGLAGVPLEVVSLQREYLERVVGYVLEGLRAGRTPSPDVMCNRRIKFGAFVERWGAAAEAVASGHYARTRRREDGRTELLSGVDPVKDQTYFLSQLTQEQVARCRFPVGGLLKRQVRAEAAGLGLSNRSRPDSQGICFLGRVPYGAFVEHHLGRRPGAIRDRASGRVLGEHAGAWFHTIGQRRGLGLSGGPWYVVGKQVDDNVVWVVHGDRLRGHARDRFVVRSPHWIAAAPRRTDLEVRIRHGERRLACTVAAVGDGIEVRLADPDPGVAPGQFAVLYDGEVCLGGGEIALADEKTGDRV
jgi:tRNA-specific 2-thiouridylase